MNAFRIRTEAARPAAAFPAAPRVPGTRRRRGRGPAASSDQGTARQARWLSPRAPRRRLFPISRPARCLVGGRAQGSSNAERPHRAPSVSDSLSAATVPLRTWRVNGLRRPNAREKPRPKAGGPAPLRRGREVFDLHENFLAPAIVGDSRARQGTYLILLGAALPPIAPDKRLLSSRRERLHIGSSRNDSAF